MTRLIDLTGRRFGRYVVLRRAIGDYSHPMWLCRCDCGAEKVVRGDHLRAGLIQSCRCYMIDRTRQTKTTHGDCPRSGKSRLYGVWRDMKNRCYNPNVSDYKNYGGRGIVICEEWKSDYAAFRKWAMGSGYDECAKRSDCTIDRIDNNGNYEPCNCRFSTALEQAQNKRPRKERKVEQYTLDGQLVGLYASCRLIESASSRHRGHTIAAACRGTRKTAYGYKWRYVYDGQL